MLHTANHRHKGNQDNPHRIAKLWIHKNKLTVSPRNKWHHYTSRIWTAAEEGWKTRQLSVSPLARNLVGALTLRNPALNIPHQIPILILIYFYIAGALSQPLALTKKQCTRPINRGWRGEYKGLRSWLVTKWERGGGKKKNQAEITTNPADPLSPGLVTPKTLHLSLFSPTTAYRGGCWEVCSNSHTLEQVVLSWHRTIQISGWPDIHSWTLVKNLSTEPIPSIAEHRSGKANQMYKCQGCSRGWSCDRHGQHWPGGSYGEQWSGQRSHTGGCRRIRGCKQERGRGTARLAMCPAALSKLMSGWRRNIPGGVVTGHGSTCCICIRWAQPHCPLPFPLLG